jgi:hypothetical protein
MLRDAASSAGATPVPDGGSQVLLAAADRRQRRSPGPRPSEWVEAALEQAELVAFGIGEDVPGRLRRLTDVDEFGPSGQEAPELGVLVAVGGVDVDVQPGMPVPRIVVTDEEDRRLRAAEPFARTYLDAALRFAIDLDKVQDLAPEPRQHLGVSALEHKLTDTACH